jgi:hypothetical protein
VGHPLQVERAGAGVGAEERERDDGHVVDALGLDDRLEHTQPLGQPVGMGVHGVVQAHQRLDAWHADLVLDRQHRQPRPRDRHHVLDAGDLGQHLLGRAGDHLFDIADAGPGKGDQHVGHGHVDLRLFLARRHEHCEEAEQQGDQGQQRRDLRGLEERCDAAGGAERR